MNKSLKILSAMGLLWFLVNRKNATASTGNADGSNIDIDDGVMALSYLGAGCAFPRGMRNNNPGNLRVSSSSWQGKIPLVDNQDVSCPDGVVRKEFEQFETYVWGTRAMTKLLQNYIAQGFNTITEIISRYAPASDGNNVLAYINDVSQRTGFPANNIIEPTFENMAALVTAMAAHENGRVDAILQNEFETAWTLL